MAQKRQARAPRVVIATRLFSPEVGAAAFRLRALADGLVESGAELRVLTTRPPRSVEFAAVDERMTVSRFPVARDAGGNVRGYLQYLSFDIPLFFRLLFTRADVVVSEPPPTTGMVTAITSWIRRRPYVYYAADVWTDAVASTSAPGFVVRMMRFVETRVLRGAALVLAVSPDLELRVREFGARSVAMVGNGVDTTVFTAEGSGHADRAPYFAYTGTMSEWQGADVFIRALPTVLPAHPGTQLHFLGQGSHEPELRKLAAQLAPDSVVFHGVLPPRDAASWLRTAAGALVSIVPGKGYDFAMPTKLYAAAACGTPIIYAGAGAAAALVAESGLGDAPGYDIDAVAEAMRSALDAFADGTTARRAVERAAWATANASLAAVGARAAEAVLAARVGR